MNRTLWLYWETPKGMRDLPAHIALCRKSVEIHARGVSAVLVTPDNLREYLPKISRRIFDIEAIPKGRIDRHLHRGRRKASAVAQRADFVRAFLLEKYGGFYIDSDAILLADPAPFFSLLDTYDCCVTMRGSFGKTHASVGFYGSRAMGAVISEYANCLRKRLEGPLQYTWNEVGAAMLTPIIDRYHYRASVYAIPEAEVEPVPFEVAGSMFVDRSIKLEDVISPGTRIFMLYHGPFGNALRGMGMKELYRSDMLISKVFRAAIPETALGGGGNTNAYSRLS